MRRHHVFRVGSRIDPDTGAARRMPRSNSSWTGTIGERILRVDTALQGVASELDILLAVGQPISGGNQDLVPKQVDAGHHFGHAMLNLDSRVHLHEVKVPVPVHEEFEGAGARITEVLNCLDDLRTHALAERIVDDDRRGLLEKLLMTPLDRALPFPQMNGVAVFVRQDLKLDVTGGRQIFLDVAVGDSEGRVGL
jgi:hypothetical protein